MSHQGMSNQLTIYFLAAALGASVWYGTGYVEAGTIYKWVDAQGRIHYTDKKPTNGKQLDAKEAPKSGFSAPQRDEEEQESKQPRQDSAARGKQAELDAQKAKRRQEYREQDCKKMKERLAQYESAHRLMEEGQEGEKRVLEGEERDKIVNETRDEVRRLCDE